MSWVLAEFRESLFEDIQELRSFESSSILLARRDVNKDLIPKDQDKDKDLTLKDQNKDKDLLDLTPKDKDLTPKDQDKNKDLKYVLKESLRTRTRTRTTARQII